MSRIVVAMSGGVDSSVAAALLKKQGHEVIGMMLRLWSEPGREADNRCCSPDSMAMARRVAARLEIPFYVVDAREIFHETVVKYFLDGYAAGNTPNPCLVCNRLVRWEFLLQHSLDMEAEFMATGHYARICKDEGGVFSLLRGVDRTKDQSYVLHILTQEKLARALFPVGEFPKAEIRHLAQQFDLPVASRADSQDLCFLAGEDYRDFLRRNAPEIASPGPIQTLDGRVLGRHAGLAYYTIGQRKGLGVTSTVPLYVLSKDRNTNALVVGPVDQLGSSVCRVVGINWIAGSPPSQPSHLEVKTRYTAREAWAEVTPSADGMEAGVRFDTPVQDLTSGQAAVFYKGDLVLGGGMIVVGCV